MPPPYCSLPSSQAPCNHSHACPLILASNRYFLLYHSNRHIHVQSTWTWHGVTQHSHCARMSIRKVAARVMLSPLDFALHCTLFHIGCGPPHPICFLGKPRFESNGCSSTFATFLFGAPTWLTLKLHGPPVLPRNNTPPPPLRCECDAGRSPQRLKDSPVVVHLIIDGLFCSTTADWAWFGGALSSLPEGHDSVTN